MRIRCQGGHSPGSQALAAALRARGHKVQWVASPEVKSLGSDWDVLLLLGPQETSLDQLEGRRVLFADTIENHRIGSLWPESLPYSTPIDIEETHGHWRKKGASSEVSVLLCCDEMEQALSSKNLRAKIDCCPASIFENIVEFRQRLHRHDVVVLDLERASYGSWAVEALASGATVLAPHPQPQSAQWAPIKHSPVIGVTQETLFLKLDKICREPRCISDLSRRGLRFVEEYHDARKIAALFESWIQADQVKRSALQVRAKDMACDLLN